MNKELIDKLENIRKNEPVNNNSSRVPRSFPKEYVEFLELYNGGIGFIGENTYVQLWSVDEIAKLNIGYMVEEFIPGIILIGSDGAEMAYGIKTDGRFIEVPFIGMDYDEVKIVANNFNEFINYLDK